MVAAPEFRARRLGDRQGGLGRDRFSVGGPADPVGAE
jgi:hypothetical protein